MSNKGEENGPASTVNNSYDPLLAQPPNVVREGDFCLLIFPDGKQIFAQCLKDCKGRTSPVRIMKRSYPTCNLIGLPYGTVLELGPKGLVPLDPSQGLLPDFPVKSESGDDSSTKEAWMAGQTRDNRNIVDDNTSQALNQKELLKLRQSGATGSTIIQQIIENSSTFEHKTDFSKAKYIARKQIKHQPRCRLVRCTAASICEALFLKDPKKIMNLREDTMGQILSYSNISAGCQAIVLETVQGVITGAMAQRMGGYGKILSIYSGQQPSFTEMLQRFNLSFAENFSIKWLHSGDVFGDHDSSDCVEDLDKADREACEWPCPLQDHTRNYLEKMPSDKERNEFLAKRCARFTRKLTRHSPNEAKEWLLARKSDSVVIVARYDPTATLLGLLPYLAPSCPFVVYCEFIEPLTECFRELQKQDLAINLRLSDTWTREYQVLPGRTHPNMNMSQSGGFILTGIKLDEEFGHNDLDEKLLKEIREQIGGRRGRKQKGDKANSKKGKSRKKSSSPSNIRNSKRPRTDNDTDSG